MVVVVVVVAGDRDIGGQVSGYSHSVGEMMYPEKKEALEKSL